MEIVQGGRDGLYAAVGADSLLGIVKILQVLSQCHIRHLGESLSQLGKIHRAVLDHHIQNFSAPFFKAFCHGSVPLAFSMII